MISPQFEQWLLDHTKGLHIRTQHGNTIYTAMLIRLNGDPYLLTAGHCLKELDDARRMGIKIEEASLLPTNGSLAFSIISIEEIQLYYLYEPGSIDIGLIPLRKWYENQLENEMFLEVRHFTNLPLKFTGCMLIGFPAEFEKFKETVIDLNPVYISVSPTSKPEAIPEAEPPRFFGKIPEIDFSIKGMSGGPIMGFWHDDEKNEIQYWIIALQSGWFKTDNLICGTYLSTGIPILLRSVISDHSDPPNP